MNNIVLFLYYSCVRVFSILTIAINQYIGELKCILIWILEQLIDLEKLLLVSTDISINFGIKRDLVPTQKIAVRDEVMII